MPGEADDLIYRGTGMNRTEKRVDALGSGTFLIGLGVLFATGWWWPGIMFVVGLTAIVEALAAGRGWYAFQAGSWSILIGVWAIFHFAVAALFIGLGTAALLGYFVKEDQFAKPKVNTDPLAE